jgi:hypothetical protein
LINISLDLPELESKLKDPTPSNNANRDALIIPSNEFTDDRLVQPMRSPHILEHLYGARNILVYEII